MAARLGCALVGAGAQTTLGIASGLSSFHDVLPKPKTRLVPCAILSRLVPVGTLNSNLVGVGEAWNHPCGAVLYHPNESSLHGLPQPHIQLPV